MELLTIASSKLEITPYALTITEFKGIWDKDSLPTKDNAVKELSFVYFMADYKSPYISYEQQDRWAKVAKDISLPMPIPPDLIAAVKKYEEIQESASPTLRLLKATERTLSKIEAFYNSYNPAIDLQGNKFRSIITSMRGIDGIIKSLNTLKKQVELELTTATQARGGHTISNRELPPERRRK